MKLRFQWPVRIERTVLTFKLPLYGTAIINGEQVTAKSQDGEPVVFGVRGWDAQPLPEPKRCLCGASAIDSFGNGTGSTNHPDYCDGVLR